MKPPKSASQALGLQNSVVQSGVTYIVVPFSCCNSMSAFSIQRKRLICTPWIESQSHIISRYVAVYHTPASSGTIWGDFNRERVSISGGTYVIEHTVGLPASYAGRCLPLIYLAGNYSIEPNRRRSSKWRGVRRSALGRSGNRAMHSPCPPLLSPIANYWSDMWFVDELVRWVDVDL